MNFNAPNDYYELECDTSKIPIPTAGALDLPEGCDKFRILLAGQCGVGKSTLKGAVFGMTPRAAGVSNLAVGTSIENIYEGVNLPGNPQLILHDSAGFLSGDLQAVDAVVNFIHWRRQQVNLSDQLHCIWYCISLASGRPIQTADEKFLRNVNVGQIPIVIVFTQFDMLVERCKKQLRRRGYTESQLDHVARNAAISEYTIKYREKIEREFPTSSRVTFAHVGIPEAEYEENVDVPLTTLSSDGIDALIDSTTERLVNKSLRILWVSGQRHNANAKLLESPSYGMSMFWRVQASSAFPIIGLVGATGVYTAFSQVLSNMSGFWRLDGTLELIKQSKIRNKILSAVFDVNVPQRIGASFLLAVNPLGPLLAHPTANIFIKMVAGLSLIHEMLFWRQIDNGGVPITAQDIDFVTADFQQSERRERMAHHIDGKLGLLQGYSKQACENVIASAIRQGRSDRYADYVRMQTISTS